VDVRKLARMHALVARLLAELRDVTLDPASLVRLEALVQQTLVDIGSAVPADLLDELGRIFHRAARGRPTGDELRVVDAQMLGWLRGLASAPAVDDATMKAPEGRDAADAKVGYL
jgi:hypothetical protein